MPESAINKKWKLSVFLSFFLSFFFPGLTRDCLDFLDINQLQFIMRRAVLHWFYHSFSYRNETFSAHFVARFITEHFVAMYACSEPHAPHTLIAMALRLTHGSAHIQCHNYATLEFPSWRRLVDRGIRMLCYFLDIWTLGHDFVKVWLPNAAIVSCPTSFRPHPSAAMPATL